MTMTPFSAMTHVDIGEPRPGERCYFHPGCCDDDDMTCQGCGAEAIGVILFRRDREAIAGRRTPFCERHRDDISEAIVQLIQQHQN